MQFKVEVIADASGKWTGNMMRFETQEAAIQYARDLSRRWTSVTAWQVIKEALPLHGEDFPAVVVMQEGV